MIDLQTLARALGGEVSRGQVLAPGPGHTNGDRSLSVKLDDRAPDGFVVYSFAGDDPIVCRDHVRAKIGLPAFKPNGNGKSRISDDVIERAVMAAAQTQHREPFKIVATYDYTDAIGGLLYQVVRLDPKEFRQRRPGNDGKWKWDLNGQARVPYRLPELVRFPDATVFVCEGEKDADRVASIGLCATTAASGKWTQECVAALAGRDVVILQDNDGAGTEKATEAARLLHSIAKSVRVVLLPDLPDKGDVSDWLDADPHRASKLTEVCFDVPEWMPRTADAKAEETSTENKPTGEPPLPFINIAAWHDQPVPERQWTVKDRIPASNVTLLSGEGSVGKSILSLQLAVAVVLGRDWLGTLPEPGAALVACCEDDEKELWRRLDLIFAHYGAAYTEFKDMHLVALAGQETIMAAPDRNGLIQTTKLFGRIREAACDIKPKLIVLDNSADVYGGNENDRAQVRQFIGLLRGMAIASGAGVLLTSHPSLTGINTGTGLSGSTAWNASVRSRLYFKRAVTDKDEEPDPDMRVLEVMKSNYGPIGETINLRWKDGLFLPVAGVSGLDRMAFEQTTEHLFLSLLNRFKEQGRNLSDNSRANNYAPLMMAKEKEARDLKRRKADFEIAMRNLFAADKIRMETYGPPSKVYSRLVLK
jgi:RecA-family ATPase